MSNQKLKVVEEFKEIIDAKMDRRYFLKCSAFLGGSLAASNFLVRYVDAAAAGGNVDWAALGVGDAYTHYLPENQIYSACQQCNTQCGIKVKIVDGLVAKIDGNPYSPWTMTPQIAYKTPITEAAIIEGALCPKGQAGIQALYDPYRIVKVLKRAGKRGENKWQTIPFEQAVTEIVNGGNLFGEGNVEGLKDICVLQGPQDRQGVGGRRRPGSRQENGAGGLQGQARRQSEISHRSGPPGPGTQEQPVRPQCGPAQGGTGRSVEALCQWRLWARKINTATPPSARGLSTSPARP